MDETKVQWLIVAIKAPDLASYLYIQDGGLLGGQEVMMRAAHICDIYVARGNDQEEALEKCGLAGANRALLMIHRIDKVDGEIETAVKYRSSR